ncbi:MAG: tetratricopeptide repeat protein [Cyanobacteriota bacterium]|nr:tetratricopeptide repeat protein [Cyanobacteriota bacterium]
MLETIQQQIENADRLREQGQLDEAVAAYQHIIQLDLENHQSYTSLGAIFLEQKKYEEAEIIYHQAISLSKNHGWSYCNLGRSLLSQGRVEEAIPYLQKAIAIDPSIADFYYYCGNALTKQGYFEKATNAYRKASELEPDKFIYYHQLGDSLLLQGKFEEAISPYRKAIELNAEYAWCHTNLARALAELGQHRDAIDSYRQAIALDPQQPSWVRQNLERLLRMPGIDGGTATATQTTALPQPAAETLPEQDYFSLGSQHEEAGEVELALDCYRKAIALHPEQAHYHQRLADILMQVGQFDEAVAAYRQSLELNPDSPWACRGLGNVLQAQSQYEKATALYYRSIELYPDDYHTYELLADTLAKQGKFAEAIEAYRGALEKNPQETRFQQRIETLKPKAAPDYFRLGEERSDTEQWSEAIAYYRQAITLNLPGEAVHHRLGHALCQQGQLYDAFTAYQTALELNPDCWHTNKGLGAVLERQENFPDAIAAYRRALEVQPAQAAVRQKSDEAAVPMDVVVTYNEVNNKHGTGILILRLFKESPDIFAIRSRSDYEGDQDFGDVAVHCECSGLSRAELYERVIADMEGIDARRVLCIPYSANDLLMAIAIRDIFGVKLCTYIMDDQNVRERNIPDELMREALEKSSLRLSISPEIRDAYEQKYGLDFWLLPGLVPDNLLQHQLTEPAEYQAYTQTQTGILVGNIWAQRWLDSLRSTIRDFDLTIDWYANPNPGGLTFKKDELHQDGLIQKGLVPEPKLVQILRQHPYAVLPSGSSDDPDDRPEISKLSLPSRIPFIWATSNTPIIVMGSRETAAARFIEKFNAGVVCDYNPDRFREAVEYVCHPENHRTLRQNAMDVGQALSVRGIDKWIWDSLERGEPEDMRFERLLPRTGGGNIITGKSQGMDILVNHNEINDRHGTGIFLLRLFQESKNIFSIRTNNHYGGEQEFGEIAIHCDCSGLSRPEVFRQIAREMEGIEARRILCVPYFPEDVLLSLAIKEIFGIPLCTYIMDDQNIHEPGIPDELMGEVLEKSDLRLAISPELGQAYEEKYSSKFWVLPAVAPKEFLQTEVRVPEISSSFYSQKRGVLIGNVWAQRWLDSLQQTLKETGIKVDWYGAANPTNISFDVDELRRDGLDKKGFIPEKELIELLKQYPYAILTTGNTEEVNDRPEMAKLSLPSRLTYIASVSNTPIIVLGSKATAAARFVERFNLGVVCDYTPSSFRQAVDYVCEPEVQRTLRENATKVALGLSSEGIDRWIWQSLEQKQPIDLRFEELMNR